MKTLDEICEELKTNGRPDYEDVRYAALALNLLLNAALRDRSNLLNDINLSPHRLRTIRESNIFEKAFKAPPKDFLGPSYDPENPEYQKTHKIFKRLLDAAMNGRLPNQTKENEKQ